MELNYKNVKDFWNERCKRYGHTGYADQLRYAYDQPLRLRAVKRALSHLGIPADKYTCILDVGCGEGTFVFEFGRKGASVTGIDISSEALKRLRSARKSCALRRIFIYW